jgi:small subunit ribosomal protein S6
MQEYEIAVLYHPDLEVDLSKAEERVTAIFKNNKGTVVSADNWGKRKLAYPIQNLEHAIYVFYTLEIEPTRVQKIETTLNITDEVIRFLITRVDAKERAKAKAAKAEKEQQAADRAESNTTSDNKRDSDED